MISTTIQPKLHPHEQLLTDPKFVEIVAAEIKDKLLESLKENLNSSNMVPSQDIQEDILRAKESIRNLRPKVEVPDYDLV